MKIKDFMDLKTLQKIQDAFSDATGLAAIAVDAEGNYITSGSNFTDFCMKYTRGSEEGMKRCVKCDNECTGTYYCHAGLMDFAADIIVENEKVGAIIGGQVLPEEPDLEKFRGIARELGVNEDAYVRAVQQVPIKTEKSIRAASGLLQDVVNRLVNLEYIKHRAASRNHVLDEELDKSMRIAQDIADKTKKLEAIASKEKILTLNATIEAARAGESGRGFAVVGKQMGELTKDSVSIFEDIQEDASQIMGAMKRLESAGLS